MNMQELKAEIVRQNLTIPQLANLIHMNKTTLYARINGKVCFSQQDIIDISNVLHLNADKIFEIFFANKVS